MVAVAEDPECTCDAAVGLEDDAGEDLLTLLETEPLDVEVRHPDSPSVVTRVLPIMGVYALHQALEQVGDLAGARHLELRLARYASAVLIERSLSQPWLSNTYLVVDEETSDAVLIDAGGPVEPLLSKIDGNYRLTHVLLTHHHHDHVAELDHVTARYPDVPVLIHPLERSLVAGATGDLGPGEEIKVGSLNIAALHTPGHTAGMISLLIDGTDVFTGDTLFKGSVGGVRAPGSTNFADLRHSIMDVLLALPPETRIHPGHTDATTVAAELSHNPFVRVWRGVDPEGTEPCKAFGEDATLIVLATDYDAGTKGWVRWPDGRDDTVPGSQLTRSPTGPVAGVKVVAGDSPPASGA